MSHGLMSFDRHGVYISGPLLLHETCRTPVEAPMRIHVGYAHLS